ECDVSGARDHWVIAVGAALPRGAGMHMHVGNDPHAALLADVPERPEIPPVEMHDAGVERVRVEVVVEDEIGDASAAVYAVAEQECAALAGGVPAALAQLPAQALPQKPRAGDFMLRRP